uniref:Transposase-associated domain-containing protein n=1 Tax=Oryza sativa subsp. japonica TaxID=39947 RepID=Q60DA1_ORYSJ|nr:hypothetical protein [Oryza sativa Japonica Group]
MLGLVGQGEEGGLVDVEHPDLLAMAGELEALGVGDGLVDDHIGVAAVTVAGDVVGNVTSTDPLICDGPSHAWATWAVRTKSSQSGLNFCRCRCTRRGSKEGPIEMALMLVTDDSYRCRASICAPMNRSWMYTTGLRRQYKEYRDDVLSFMKAAEEDRIRRNDKYMCCPCSDCKNEISWENEKEVHAHLIRRGFMERYTCWVKHGEQDPGTDGAAVDGSGANNHEGDEEEHDMFVPSPLGGEMVHVDPDLLQDLLRDVDYPAMNERDSMKFSRLVSDSETPLYTGCKPKHTKLSATLDLMKLKASSGWSDKSFTKLLGILKDMLPQENTLPETTYEAKQVMCPLGLEVRRIHACPNDCILYHKQYADLDACPVCNTSERRARRRERSQSGVVQRRLCGIYQSLVVSREYLPTPMKQSPRQPGNDIDVFLKPVIDDLENLWKEGVETWDAYGQENFTLRVILFCTINDYPTLGNLSGQTVKGKKACSDCMEHTHMHRSWIIISPSKPEVMDSPATPTDFSLLHSLAHYNESCYTKGLFGICVACLELPQTLPNLPQRKRSLRERRKLKQKNKINKTRGRPSDLRPSTRRGRRRELTGARKRDGRRRTAAGVELLRRRGSGRRRRRLSGDRRRRRRGGRRSSPHAHLTAATGSGGDGANDGAARLEDGPRRRRLGRRGGGTTGDEGARELGKTKEDAKGMLYIGLD